MKKIILTGFFAAVLVFTWGVFSWMVLPWHQATLNHLVNEKEVTEVMMKNAQPGSSKIYSLPGECAPASPTQPHLFIAYVPEHLSMMQNMLVGFLLQLITALTICFLLSKTTGLLYLDKVMWVTLVGLLIGVNSYGATWNWWGFASDYTLVGIADSIISWFLGALLIAKKI